jgi:hypothetical protein
MQARASSPAWRPEAGCRRPEGESPILHVENRRPAAHRGCSRLPTSTLRLTLRFRVSRVGSHGAREEALFNPETHHRKEEPQHSLNNPEARLRRLLINAGLPEPEAQKTITLGDGLGTTIPDFYYHSPNEQLEGICIYLDGMHETIHGNVAHD